MEVTRLKVNFEVSLGDKYVGTFVTMQKAKAAAATVRSVADTLGYNDPVTIKEVALKEEKAA
jgi:hypothetical protein